MHATYPLHALHQVAVLPTWEWLHVLLASFSYGLNGVAGNFTFPVALILTKQCAPSSRKEFAIGVHQSVCSLGSAIGPLPCGSFLLITC